MILLSENIKAYKVKRDTFLNQIKNNFDAFYDDKHDDLSNIIKFVNFNDSFIQELILANQLTESIQTSFDKENDSLSRVIRHYNIDAEFNKTKADKWLINALVLVVRDSNTFDGIMFTKGKDKVLKTKILKH